MVRATFAGFSTAFSALQANQKRLDITGQNLANMNTTGYTRQQLQVSSLNYTNPVSHYMSTSEVVVGFGVHMDKVTQIRDPYLDIQYRDQMQKSGYSNSLQTSFDELAQFLDESHITGIRNAFDDVRSTLNNMTDPSKIHDKVFESELRTRIQTLTNLLNDGARQINTYKENEYHRLDGTGTSEQGAIDTVNNILQQIGRLNRQIKQNQIYGQPSLELMDERNVLLDELSSYIPIEVTYYKDKEHNGLAADGATEVLGEKYHLDSAGNIIMKKEWPDDLRVTMTYTKPDGTSDKLVLVEGTVGTGDENYGKLSIGGAAGDDYSGVTLTFDGCFKNPVNPDVYGEPATKVSLGKAANINYPFPSGSGSIQAGLDMLWKDGKTPGLNDVKGYDYYMNELDKLASTFGYVMNVINDDHGGGFLISGHFPEKGAALNIGISQDWINGTAFVGKDGDNATDGVKYMFEAMQTEFNGSAKDSDLFKKYAAEFAGLDLDGNTFANYMNHISTVHANDSYANQISLKTNVTVLNGIQNSRDSISGVSLDEEASNMMMYMSAYNAASRLMTTLDPALDVLINNTGVVGR